MEARKLGHRTERFAVLQASLEHHAWQQIELPRLSRGARYPERPERLRGQCRINPLHAHASMNTMARPNALGAQKNQPTEHVPQPSFPCRGAVRDPRSDGSDCRVYMVLALRRGKARPNTFFTPCCAGSPLNCVGPASRHGLLRRIASRDRCMCVHLSFACCDPDSGGRHPPAPWKLGGTGIKHGCPTTGCR